MRKGAIMKKKKKQSPIDLPPKKKVSKGKESTKEALTPSQP